MLVWYEWCSIFTTFTSFASNIIFLHDAYFVPKAPLQFGIGIFCFAIILSHYEIELSLYNSCIACPCVRPDIRHQVDSIYGDHNRFQKNYTTLTANRQSDCLLRAVRYYNYKSDDRVQKFEKV